MPLLWQLQWRFRLITGSFEISVGSLGHPESWVMPEVPVYFICSRERCNGDLGIYNLENDWIFNFNYWVNFSLRRRWDICLVSVLFSLMTEILPCAPLHFPACRSVKLKAHAPAACPGISQQPLWLESKGSFPGRCVVGSRSSSCPFRWLSTTWKTKL